jgi:RNA polymerase sigma-70 factor (ECF subfamily)
VGRDEFERLYEEHAGGLFGFLAYRTGDASLAEDLLADTFERAFKARRRFDPRRGGRKTWLYAIALNLLRDEARRSAVRARVLERTPVAAGVTGWYDQSEDVERRDLVARAMQSLSAAEREAVALRFGAGLTLPEVAKVTGQPLTTAEGRVYRALRRLHSELADAGEGRLDGD